MNYTPSIYPCSLCPQLFKTAEAVEYHWRTTNHPQSGMMRIREPNFGVPVPSDDEEIQSAADDADADDADDDIDPHDVDMDHSYTRKEIKEIEKCIKNMKKDKIERKKRMLYQVGGIPTVNAESDESEEESEVESENEDKVGPPSKRFKYAGDKEDSDEDSDEEPLGLQDAGLDVIEALCYAAKEGDLTFRRHILQVILDNLEDE